MYPLTRMGPVVDTLHGHAIPDPYRWLEDPDGDDTAAWIRAQNVLSRGWLDAQPLRVAFHERLTALWNYARISVPHRLPNGVLFYQRNSGLQKQAEVVARSSAQTPPRVVLDPNALSPDGSIAMSQYEPSPSGRHIAYALSEGGADWQDVRVRDVRTGEDMDDVLHWVRFSALAWTRDGLGFFYSRYPAADSATRLRASLQHQKLYYHRLGTPQNEDVLIFERPDLATWFIQGMTSEDGKYLFIYMSKGADAHNRLYVADLGTPRKPDVSATVKPLVETDDGEYSVIGNDGTTVYLQTDLNAPNRRVVAVDMARPDRSRWRTVVANDTSSIAGVAMTSSGLVVHRLADVTSRLTLYNLQGRVVREVDLPGVGTVAAISSTSSTASFYFSYTSHLQPATVYRYDATSRKVIPMDPPTLTFDPGDFETERVFAISKDGTRVPLFISHRKGVPRNGTSATVLYAYGGFAVNVAPTFSPSGIAWMEKGGTWVTASLRGGLEYGEAWHQAGMRAKKQNVFDDFIAAAEYLTNRGYTSRARLAINGGSNGGLLVGAVMTQRPELFAAAIPQVGVLDMLRYHHFTGGSAWVTEYGSADNAADFAYLRKYSPLHNIEDGRCFPATLITTADHDDRVIPGHSYKFTAALQKAQGCDSPILLRVETQGSHGYRPTDRQIAESADVWTFAAIHTGLSKQ